jgi:hypothetical protein
MTNLSDSITSLRTMLDTCETEVKSLETNSRKASSARARKSLQNIKTSCHGLRKDITEYTKALPTKARVKKEIIAAVEAEPEAIAEPDIEAVEPVKPKKTRKPKVKANTSI